MCVFQFDYKEDETFEKDSSKSANRSRIDDFLEQSDEEEFSVEDIRSQEFDRRLLGSRSLSRIIPDLSENEKEFQLKSNPQEGLNLQIPIIMWKSQVNLYDHDNLNS